MQAIAQGAIIRISGHRIQFGRQFVQFLDEKGAQRGSDGVVAATVSPRLIFVQQRDSRFATGTGAHGLIENLPQLLQRKRLVKDIGKAHVVRSRLPDCRIRAGQHGNRLPVGAVARANFGKGRGAGAIRQVGINQHQRKRIADCQRDGLAGVGSQHGSEPRATDCLVKPGKGQGIVIDDEDLFHLSVPASSDCIVIACLLMRWCGVDVATRSRMNPVRCYHARDFSSAQSPCSHAKSGSDHRQLES